MKKLYEVIFVDEYNNFDLLGWFDNLDDAIEPINNRLEVYGDYKLENGDFQEYPGTFGSCIDMSLSNFFVDKLGEEYEDKIYGDIQCCEVRGFVHELDDTTYEILKQILVNEPCSFDFSGFKLTYDRLIEMIKNGQNSAILAYLEKDKEKALYELSGSTLKEYTEITKDKTYIDFDKAKIKKEDVKDKEFWNEFLNQYKDKRVLCDDISINDIEYIGCQVFQYEFYKYYTKGNDLFIQKFTYYNNRLKCVGLYMTSRKDDVVC